MADKEPPRRGIPLDELRNHEQLTELRTRRRWRSTDEEDTGRIARGSPSPHTGATPVPVERDDTSRLGIEVAGAFAATGSAAQVAADMESLIDRLASKLHEKVSQPTGGGGHGGGPAGPGHHRVITTIAAALGIVFALATAWWGFSERMSDRPTRQELKELLQPRDATMSDQGQQIRSNTERLIRVDETLKAVNSTMGEVKVELRESRDRRQEP